MFSGIMANTWLAASVVAGVAGVVGFFTVLRGSSFAAHALPNGAFAGAAGATLVGASTLAGLAVFSVAGALAIAALGRRARRDVATALAVVVMLATGALFLSLGTAYAPEVYALLFGQLFGVSRGDLAATAGLGLLAVLATAVLYRRFMLSSVLSEVAESRGVGPGVTEVAFLLVLALVTTVAVPVVGALLVFSLLVAPAATARCLTDRPGRALALGVAVALVTVWVAVAVSYLTNLPLGFLVGALGAAFYAAARGVGSLSGGRLGPAPRSGCE